MSINRETFFSHKNITVQDFFTELFRRWYLCAMIVVICVAVALTYAKVFLTPMYDSGARLYIVNKTVDNVNSINSSDLAVSTYLVNDFAEIIMDKVILNDVAVDLNNEFTVGQLSSFLSVEIPQSTRIIQINARTNNPETSKKVVDSVCRISEQKLVEIMGLDRVTVISEGSLPKAPSIPNTKTIVVFGLIVSIILSILIVYVFIVTDNKITSSKDIEKYLGINVLATIPYNANKSKAKS